jgi:hypothetical protein
LRRRWASLGRVHRTRLSHTSTRSRSRLSAPGLAESAEGAPSELADRRAWPFPGRKPAPRAPGAPW